MSIFKKIQFNAPVILIFALVSLLVLGLGAITNNQSTYLLFSVYRSPMQDVFFWFRLFGHVLGHANFEHYFNNILILLLIGPILEEKYGSRNIILMIIFTALLTGILNVLLFDTALLGASGIVFMFILLSSFTNVQKGRIPVTLFVIAGIYIGREVYDAVFGSDNISQITHIFGGLCGSLFGFWLNKE